jgi:hypothetical protein
MSLGLRRNSLSCLSSQLRNLPTSRLTAEVHILHQRFEPFGLQRLFTDELALLARVPGIVRDGVQI